jgi:hypothetical protein
MVAGLLVVGAVGYAMLSVDGLVLLAVGTVLAYGCGWGWTGLLMFATVRLNPNAPAAATGIIHTGAAAGAALGPLIFGAIVAATSFPTAWRTTAGAALLSAGLTLAARSWLLRDRDRRVGPR